MSNTRLLRMTLALLFALPLTSVLALAPPQTPLPDLQSVGALGEDLFLQSGSTGMVLVVVRGNLVFFRGYGETAPNSHQLPTEDSLLRLCSLTKIFTTDVLTKLAANKTVRLDDPLQIFAAPKGIVPSRDRPITLVELATHTSGLPRELGNAPRGTPHFTYPDYRTRWRWLAKQRLRTPPGTAALYSNIGYDFLSDALASAAHKQYAALLAQRTLNPLHMQQTTFFPSAEQCSRLLVSAHDQGPCTVTEATAGSSGLYSTATDMATWLQYLLGTGGPAIPAQDGQAQAVYILPADLVSEKGLDHAGEPTGVGLGWIHLLPLDSPSHIVEKTGGGAGFETYIAISHSARAAIFLAATDGAADSHLNLFNAANKILLAVAGLPPLPSPPPKPARTSRHHLRPRHRRSAKIRSRHTRLGP
ncbi:MAG TPA: D-alanyl-D-alanine-carboxypeptidase/endopeptidase AmpH [Acidisarcina sp.]